MFYFYLHCFLCRKIYVRFSACFFFLQVNLTDCTPTNNTNILFLEFTLFCSSRGAAMKYEHTMLTKRNVQCKNN